MQQVLSNVLVSHVQMRTEECPDILPYSHERIVQKVVVPLGHELTTIRDKYLEVINLPFFALYQVILGH